MWGLRTGAPFSGGTGAWVAPATTASGGDAVLKVVWPHREARYEADGLAMWNGDGAVRLLAGDADRWALLLERCPPGTALRDAPLPADDALFAAADVLSRLWAVEPPADGPFEHLGDVTAEWAVLLRRRMEELRPGPPFDPRLVEVAAGLLESLPASAPRHVVLHGDFNPGNLLAAERQPWLAIDAKPMVGDPGYDPEPLLSQIDRPFEAPGGRSEIARRYRLFADVVDYPTERLLAWAVARNVESALWFLARNDPAEATRRMNDATVLADIAGL